ncbi:trypsin-like serine peptidase [Rhodospirillum sp. A1_3_36]|uniref:trypsin-like serine peptidase n=1 Tax=Rhodospirillum sp. A1_3_36 TaxID=3391666 RepID=UPI0039A5A284
MSKPWKLLTKPVLPFSSMVCALALALSWAIPAATLAQSAKDLPRESDADMLRRVKPGVKGLDDRLTVDASSWPWSSVGRVNRSDGAFCTGTLIGPHQVLTAGHCLWNKKTLNWYPATGLKFAAGYQRGEWIAFSPVTSVTVSPGYRPKPPSHKGDPSQDWALLDLKDPLGDIVGYFGTLSDAPRSVTISQVGYSFDRRHVQTANVGCHILGRQSNGILMHDCDTVNGDSGSPIVHWTDEGPRVIAVHVATARTKSGNSLGMSVPIGTVMPENRRPFSGGRQVDQSLAALLVGKLGYTSPDAVRQAMGTTGSGPYDRKEFSRLLSGMVPPAP